VLYCNLLNCYIQLSKYSISITALFLYDKCFADFHIQNRLLNLNYNGLIMLSSLITISTA